jgi:LysM repeat protein
MRGFQIILILAIFLSSCKTTRYTAPTITATRSEYITAYSDIAIREMKRTGIPASIKMAQAILESGDGNSTLARRANNHFGIKCHDWTGRRIYHDDDERNECFRRYNNPEESFVDHSNFLTGRSRYASLFKLDPRDYKAWARGLKAAGYATNPQYDRLLIRIIEENELQRLDTGTTAQRSRTETRRQTKPSTPAAEASRETMSRNRVRYIIASEGDTYESITREMGLMNWEISRYNDLLSESGISEGDIIYLQPKRNRAERGVETHIVAEGETMWSISQLYGIKLDRLLNLNFMAPGEELVPGDTIYLRRDNPQRKSGRNLRPEYDL